MVSAVLLMCRSKSKVQTLDEVSFGMEEWCRSFPFLEHFALDDSWFVDPTCLVDSFRDKEHHAGAMVRINLDLIDLAFRQAAGRRAIVIRYMLL
jgi:hypothetical protein